nr:MAG TPA: Protein mago nashi-like protein [Bacteriophage sp.]
MGTHINNHQNLHLNHQEYHSKLYLRTKYRCCHQTHT